MVEGLRRVRDLERHSCTVGSLSERCSNLYASMGFTEYDLDEAWSRNGIGLLRSQTSGDV